MYICYTITKHKILNFNNFHIPVRRAFLVTGFVSRPGGNRLLGAVSFGGLGQSTIVGTAFRFRFDWLFKSFGLIHN